MTYEWVIATDHDGDNLLSVGNAPDEETMMAKVRVDLQYIPISIDDLEGDEDDESTFPERFGVLRLMHSEQEQTLIDPKRLTWQHLKALHEKQVFDVRVLINGFEWPDMLNYKKRRHAEDISVWASFYLEEIDTEEQWIAAREHVCATLKATMQESVDKLPGAGNDGSRIKHLALPDCYKAYRSIAEGFERAAKRLEKMERYVRMWEGYEEKYRTKRMKRGN